LRRTTLFDVLSVGAFSDDRLRVIWLAGGQSSPFPIDFAANCWPSLQ